MSSYVIPLGSTPPEWSGDVWLEARPQIPFAPERLLLSAENVHVPGWAKFLRAWFWWVRVPWLERVWDDDHDEMRWRFRFFHIVLYAVEVARQRALQRALGACQVVQVEIQSAGQTEWKGLLAAPMPAGMLALGYPASFTLSPGWSPVTGVGDVLRVRLGGSSKVRVSAVLIGQTLRDRKWEEQDRELWAQMQELVPDMLAGIERDLVRGGRWRKP